MPSAPVPPELQRFLEGPRAAVVATVRRDGSLVTTPTWYEWQDGKFMLNMTKNGPRERNLRRNPQIALTVLAESWYSHVSLSGQVIEFRDDPEMADADRLSMRYWGKTYPSRGIDCMSAIMHVERWHTFGDPAGGGTDAGR